MKNLLLIIAERIATDRNPNTVLICTSILKDTFIAEGFDSRDANQAAIDGMKIVMMVMANFKQTQV